MGSNEGIDACALLQSEFANAFLHHVGTLVVSVPVSTVCREFAGTADLALQDSA